MSSSLLHPAGSRQRTARATGIAGFLAALRQLVPSAEPAVVLTSLANICVPALSDECLVFVTETGTSPYQISHPSPDPEMEPAGPLPQWQHVTALSGQQIAEHWVSTPIQPPPGSCEDLDYRGTLLHRWHGGYRPTQDDAALAQVALDQAVGLISQERSADHLRASQRAKADLQVALSTNRDIGAAIGILMATQRISSSQAFDRLRLASQHRHRKLREIAEDVLFTGALDFDLPSDE